MMENTSCQNCGRKDEQGLLAVQPWTWEPAKRSKLFAAIPNVKRETAEQREDVSLCHECSRNLVIADIANKTGIAQLEMLNTKIPVEKIFPLLGNLTDAEICRVMEEQHDVSCSRERIRQIRELVGIEKHERYPLPAKGPVRDQLIHDLDTKGNTQIMQEWNVSLGGLQRWRKLLQIPKPTHKEATMAKTAIAMPKDFEKKYNRMTFKDLADHYGVSVMTAYRWSKAIKGLQKKTRKLEIPKDFGRRFYQMKNEDLAAHYRVSPAIIWRWSKDLGLKPKRDPGARAVERKGSKRGQRKATQKRTSTNGRRKAAKPTEDKTVGSETLRKYFAEHVDQLAAFVGDREKRTFRPGRGIVVEIRAE